MVRGRSPGEAEGAEGTARVRVRRLEPDQDADLPLPRYMSDGAAGMDVVAAVSEPLVLSPLDRCAVPTGLVLEMPAGMECQVRPRSGLALRHGVTVANAPGTIDSDYRGEVRVLLVNLGREPYTIRRGDRVAQLVFGPVARVRLEMAEDLVETRRGPGGFGSTGL